MQSKYHPIRIEPQHEQLFAKHLPLIGTTFKIPTEGLRLVEVQAKSGEYAGVYYRMTCRDGRNKAYKIKVEMPTPQDQL